MAAVYSRLARSLFALLRIRTTSIVDVYVCELYFVQGKAVCLAGWLVGWLVSLLRALHARCRKELNNRLPFPFLYAFVDRRQPGGTAKHREANRSTVNKVNMKEMKEEKDNDTKVFLVIAKRGKK
eukprot:m.97542 g.97542  ORF g.97542 m.97542 type:complete len:125 (-) comp14834_c0_seq1:154-528(-)